MDTLSIILESLTRASITTVEAEETSVATADCILGVMRHNTEAPGRIGLPWIGVLESTGDFVESDVQIKHK